jgi:hypothetical protein
VKYREENIRDVGGVQGLDLELTCGAQKSRKRFERGSAEVDTIDKFPGEFLRVVDFSAIQARHCEFPGAYQDFWNS